MNIDCRIVDGCRGGLTFDFIPLNHADDEHSRDNPDAFSTSEDAYFLIEKAIAAVIPDWLPYRHWGQSCLSRSDWEAVFANLAEIRNDLAKRLRRRLFVQKHLLFPQFLLSNRKLDHHAIAVFLDQFEQRVRHVLQTYPYLMIWGV